MNISEWIRNLEIGLCLRRKHILAIGTNRSKLLEYIKDKFNVPSSPSNFIHTNTFHYITERKVSTLSMNELVGELNNNEYDEVLFYSTSANVSVIAQLSIEEKLKKKLKLVSYV